MGNTQQADPQEQDLSMEEILQSIRKIIADEGDAPSDGTAQNAPTLESTPTAGANAMDSTEEQVTGSDVLELTDMLDAAPSNIPASTMEPANDVMRSIDQALSAPSQPSPSFSHTILSDEAAAASAAAFKRMNQEIDAAQHPSSPSFRSGVTVEDLVLETLRPMLKSWLDAHLPGIVERIVTREVRKLAVSE